MPPREFDEKRDEALLLSLLLDGPVGEAREAVAAALELTLPNDPAWRGEREQLVLLDAALLCTEAGRGKALARVGEAGEFSSRQYHTRRAAYLDALGRPDEAAAERRRAAQLPPDDAAARLGSGMDRVRGREPSSAPAPSVAGRPRLAGRGRALVGGSIFILRAARTPNLRRGRGGKWLTRLMC